MAHWDLLPTAEDLIENLVRDDEIDDAKARDVVRSVAFHLALYRDYYRDRYEMYGEKDDHGAAEALEHLATEMRAV